MEGEFVVFDNLELMFADLIEEGAPGALPPRIADLARRRVQFNPQIAEFVLDGLTNFSRDDDVATFDDVDAEEFGDATFENFD